MSISPLKSHCQLGVPSLGLKSLAEAAAGAAEGHSLTRRRGEAEDPGDITQEQAEKLYEVMMAK